MIPRLGFAALVLVAISGCAITMNTPSVRYETPESQGKLGKGYVTGFYAGDAALTVVPDTTARPPVDQRSYSQSFVGGANGAVGITPDLDLQLITPIAMDGTAPVMFRAKYQLLGTNRIDLAPGHFDLAVSSGLGVANDSKTDSDAINGVTAKSDTDFYAVDVAVLAGYRFEKWILAYGGISYTNFSYTSKIEQTRNGTTTSYTFDGIDRQATLNFGAEFDFGHFVMRYEGAIAASASGGAHNTRFSGGGLWGFQW